MGAFHLNRQCRDGVHRGHVTQYICKDLGAQVTHCTLSFPLHLICLKLTVVKLPAVCRAKRGGCFPWIFWCLRSRGRRCATQHCCYSGKTHCCHCKATKRPQASEICLKFKVGQRVSIIVGRRRVPWNEGHDPLNVLRHWQRNHSWYVPDPSSRILIRDPVRTSARDRKVSFAS